MLRPPLLLDVGLLRYQKYSYIWKYNDSRNIRNLYSIQMDF